jgi:hypothetical protein
LSEIHSALTRRLSDLFAALPQVQAVALAGSQVRQPDPASDIDLYVYTREEIPLEQRRLLVERNGGAAQSSLGLNYWGPGDEWIDARTGTEIDIVYFDAPWMQDQIERLALRHEASLGYSTCFWHTVHHSWVFFDPHGWFHALQDLASQPYPEPLRRNIIVLNHPVLRSVIPAYAHQVAKAAARADLVSINHRLAALLASYFDILFALNRELHPGEKRLLTAARSVCSQLPTDMEADVTNVLQLAGTAGPGLVPQIDRMLGHLDELLVSNGFQIPALG